MLSQVSPVFATSSGRHVGRVPGAMDGWAMFALVLEVLLWAGQDGGLNGVPCGAVRQTFPPEKSCEQLLWSVGLNA